MFANMKTGVRLAIGFASLIVLLLVVSAVAYLRVGEIDHSLATIVDDKFPKTVVANELIGNVNLIARTLRNAALVKRGDDMDFELARTQAARKKIDEGFEKLDKTMRSDEGRKLYERAVEARKKTD